MIDSHKYSPALSQICCEAVEEKGRMPPSSFRLTKIGFER